ncbi:Cytochrome c subfamily [alpha proteobacterium IMCC14465]|uniref:Cytochrome c subfamily n=1 Tax=alpha proteobacterium IMCC14465 TaxID=1220535 RepID=J9DFM4_9PROT|nr:Cytochrome c subfamily [alpha proteobacterium IMCC14465]
MKSTSFTFTSFLVGLFLLSLPFTHQASAEDYPIGDAAAGAKVFKKCKSCHIVGAGAKNRVGPHLNNIIGRQVGSVDGFKYSKGLMAFAADNPVWTETLLDAYLLNPRKVIKGGRMAFAGLRKETDRHNVIAYLKEASAE